VIDIGCDYSINRKNDYKVESADRYHCVVFLQFTFLL